MGLAHIGLTRVGPLLPGRLVGLLEMRAYISAILKLLDQLDEYLAGIEGTGAIEDPHVANRPEGTVWFRPETFAFWSARSLCENLDLPSVRVCVQKYFEDAEAENQGEDLVNEKVFHWIRELRENIVIDLEKKHLEYVPDTLVKYYKAHYREIARLLPEAASELTEASKCLALGRNTACVFHAMRAAEHLLIAFARAVGAKNTPQSVPLEYRQWQSLIEAADKPVKKWLRQKHKDQSARTLAASVLNATVADFYAFKDSIRNDVMHTRSGLVDETFAVASMNRVVGCFERVVPYLAQAGGGSLLRLFLWA